MQDLAPIIAASRHRALALLLMVFQVAITMSVLSNTTSLVKQTLDLLRTETGYAEDEIFSFDLTPPPNQPGGYYLAQQQADLAMLRGLPGVKSAVVMFSNPMSFRSWYRNTKVGERIVNARYLTGDEQIIDALGVALAQGRGFAPDEIVRGFDTQPNVAILTQDLAQLLFPQEDALGKIFYLEDAPEQPLRIIGIIDKLESAKAGDPKAGLSFILPQLLPNHRTFWVRSQSDQVTSLMAEMEERMLALDANRVIAQPESLSAFITRLYRGERNLMFMMIAVSVLLVLVTAAGIYGLASFSLKQRTRQIGTRRALGARRWDIVRYFLTENLLFASLGVILGALLSVLLSQWILQNFSSVRLEWPYLLSAAVFIAGVGQLSVLGPAMAAAKVPPALATRSV